MSVALVGIDPDVDKSGFALKSQKTIELDNLSFFDLLERLTLAKSEYESIMVHVECGFLNGGNRHFKSGSSTAFNGKISERVGENHQVAKKICEMCEYLKIPYKQIRPTQSKVDASFFEKITKIKVKTNQEQRDAVMLIWGVKI